MARTLVAGAAEGGRTDAGGIEASVVTGADAGGTGAGVGLPAGATDARTGFGGGVLRPGLGSCSMLANGGRGALL